MKKVKKWLKNRPIVYYLHNVRNGFWKNNLQVQFQSYNILLTGIKVKNKGINNRLFIGEGCSLRNCTIKIYGDNNAIHIGANCAFCGTHFYIEDDNNEIYIGDKSTTTGDVELCAIEGTKLQLGEDCMVSSRIYISTGDGHSVCDTECARRTNQSRDIVIGDHVWIGTRVIIGKGFHIGDNCVIAAGSVCVANEKVKEDNVIIAGNPAQVVKRNINWLRERI